MRQITTILIGIALSFAMSWASYAQSGYEVKGMVLDETGASGSCLR